MTACVAATPSWRELLKLADDTEINSIVIDIKTIPARFHTADNAILKKMTAPAAASRHETVHRRSAPARVYIMATSQFRTHITPPSVPTLLFANYLTAIWKRRAFVH